DGIFMVDPKRYPTSFKLRAYERAGIKAVAAIAGREQGRAIVQACNVVDRLSFVASQQFGIDRFKGDYRTRISQAVLDLDPGDIDPKSQLGNALKQMAKEQKKEGGKPHGGHSGV
ncbi:MAG: hypothetical protein JRJ47_13745, partial [Deltaproteobacteria bacterium]|nr:hypothetical protein [Deltaproteobacteria bacterium]